MLIWQDVLPVSSSFFLSASKIAPCLLPALEACLGTDSVFLCTCLRNDNLLKHVCNTLPHA